jgi:hypothetical protein
MTEEGKIISATFMADHCGIIMFGIRDSADKDNIAEFDWLHDKKRGDKNYG